MTTAGTNKALKKGRAAEGQASLPGLVSKADPSNTEAVAIENESGESGPLAERVRPHSLEEMAGQTHLVGPEKLLARAIFADRVPSFILWGPPGCGKTTLARIVAEHTRARFVPFNAVLGGVPELRAIVAQAKTAKLGGERTILFVDEIHRFNRAQQDAFLPHVEDGTITLIGATTENPSFAVNAPLLSRCKVFRLSALTEQDLCTILERALSSDRGLSGQLTADPDALSTLAKIADGDARRALTTLEVTADEIRRKGKSHIAKSDVEEAAGHKTLLYDKAGEEHYNVVSAFIKSMRGSDPDAAVYWMMRMLDAGDDPLFVLRRMIIFASEDIGNADPRALEIALACDAAFRRLGMPEGMYPLAHACIYLASAPKSNAVNAAWHAAKEAVLKHGTLPVPMKLRNAVTKLMKEEGYGQGYRYAHNEENGVAMGETYLPEELVGERYYHPTERGYEKTIAERLRRIRGETS
ncbi:MAG: replication-associated recombination protein A [Polyangiaceae bacterium]|nr:replication-associated recombination protein A [Polyangiaceae bacterium]